MLSSEEELVGPVRVQEGSENHEREHRQVEEVPLVDFLDAKLKFPW
jgi:hypothetical protein